jgi:DNA polymerase V
MYALVDCNNFYASCERVFQPKFNGKPVAILSNNDGCVISRSNEAKALGIPMGAPIFKIKELVKEKNVQVFSSNYALYGDLSNRVMAILNQFTPNLEIYSIDEAFLNFDGLSILDYHNYGIQMKNRVQKWVGIPVCIGFAPTKALSKVANKIAKKFQERTAGVYIIDTEEKRIKALKWTKIEDVWGIGRRLEKKVKLRNINTAYDFTQPQHEAWIKKEMGVLGMRLKYELEGKSVLDLEPIVEQKKSIAITRSFPKQISDYDALRERVTTFAAVCAEKLRKQHSCGWHWHSCVFQFPAAHCNRRERHTVRDRRYLSRLHPSNFCICSGLLIRYFLLFRVLSRRHHRGPARFALCCRFRLRPRTFCLT